MTLRAAPTPSRAVSGICEAQGCHADARYRVRAEIAPGQYESWDVCAAHHAVAEAYAARRSYRPTPTPETPVTPTHKKQRRAAGQAGADAQHAAALARLDALTVDPAAPAGQCWLRVAGAPCGAQTKSRRCCQPHYDLVRKHGREDLLAPRKGRGRSPGRTAPGSPTGDQPGTEDDLETARRDLAALREQLATVTREWDEARVHREISAYLFGAAAANHLPGLPEDPADLTEDQGRALIDALAADTSGLRKERDVLQRRLDDLGDDPATAEIPALRETVARLEAALAAASARLDANSRRRWQELWRALGDPDGVETWDELITYAEEVARAYTRAALAPPPLADASRLAHLEGWREGALEALAALRGVGRG